MDERILLWLYALSALYAFLVFVRKRGVVAPRFLLLLLVTGGVSAAGLVDGRFTTSALWVGTAGFVLLLVLPGLLTRLARASAVRGRFGTARRLITMAWLLLPARALRMERDLYQAIADGGGSEHPAAAELRRRLTQTASPERGRRWAGPILVAAVLAIHLWISLAGDSRSIFSLIRAGANYGPLVMEGEYFRLVTAMFLHIGLFHLLLNAGAIWMLAGWVEPELGTARTLSLFLLTGIVGNLASHFSYGADGVVSAGASGGAMGLVGVAAAIAWFRRSDPRMRQRLSSLTLVIGATLLLGFMESGIDNGAHFGGLGAGLVLGAILERVGRLPNRVVRTVTAILLVATLAAFFQMAHASSRWEKGFPVRGGGFELTRPPSFAPEGHGARWAFRWPHVGGFTVEVITSEVPHPRGLLRRRLREVGAVVQEVEEKREVALSEPGPAEGFPGWLAGIADESLGGRTERTEIYLKRDPASGRTAVLSFILPHPDKPLRDHVIPPVLNSFRFR